MPSRLTSSSSIRSRLSVPLTSSSLLALSPSALTILLILPRRQIADRKGCTPGQISLAWVLAQGDHILPIPGTKSEKYLAENLAAADVVLSEGEVKEIDDIVFKVRTRSSFSFPRHFLALT